MSRHAVRIPMPMHATSTVLPTHVVLNLVAQQLSVRYRRAWLGFAWMLLVPLAAMSAMSLAVWLIFGARDPTYIARIVVSLPPFLLFQSTILAASGSLVASQEILRRHSVHRMVFPIAAAMVSLVEYAVASLTLVFLGPIIGIHVGPEMVSMLVGAACIWTGGIGVGLMGAIAVVHFRDLQHVLQVVLNLLYWGTPILYAIDRVPAHLRPLWDLNPLVPMLSLYTTPLVHGEWASPAALGASVGVAGVLFTLGVIIFNRHQRGVVFAL